MIELWKGNKGEVTEEPRRRRLSDEAANIGQRIIDLEDNLGKALSENENLRRRTRDAEGDLVRVKKALDEAERNMQFHLERNVKIQTKLGVAGQIILDALKEDTPPQQAFAPKPKAARAAERAVAASLDVVPEEEPQPPPKFLLENTRGKGAGTED